MTNGLIGTGLQYRQRGTQMLEAASEMEQRNKQERQMQKDAEKAQLGSNIALGGILGGTGALSSLGLAGGPVGAVVGAVGGALLSRLF